MRKFVRFDYRLWRIDSICRTNCSISVQVKELETNMGGPEGSTQIIWTSSSNAKKEAFQLDDIQHVNGYGVS